MSWIGEGEARQAVIALDGASLSSTVTGAGSPSVLWLHGGPGMFDYLAPAALALRVGTHVRFDQRGCGRSDRVGPFTLGRALQDVEDVRRCYRLNRPVVAGHSFGATLALLYALAYPAGVSGVLYISGTGLGREWRDAHHAEHDRRLTPAQRLRRDDLSQEPGEWTWEEEVEYRRLSYLPDVADREGAAGLIEPLAAAPWRLNLESNAALGAACKRDLDEAQMASQCAKLHVPVLVLHGAEDPIPPWATNSLVDALPQVQRVVLDGTGHLSFVERSAEFTSLVERFLREVSRDGP